MDPTPATVAQVVRRAVSACELGEVDDRLDDLLEQFEDADEPVSSEHDLTARIEDALQKIDPDREDPALLMAAATATYLAFRRDELDADPATLLHLAARAEFDGDPPPPVLEWLENAGVEV